MFFWQEDNEGFNLEEPAAVTVFLSPNNSHRPSSGSSNEQTERQETQFFDSAIPKHNQGNIQK